METLTSRFGMNPEADVKAAQSTLGSSEELRTFWESEPSVPYTSLCAATRAWAKDSGSKADRPSKKSRRNTTENPVFDVDEWSVSLISLIHEQMLRITSVLYVQDHTQ